MALDLIITTDRISRDPSARDFVEHVQRKAQQLGFDDAVLYYDFPTYADYDTVTHKPDALLVSRRHGVLAVRFAASLLAGRGVLPLPTLDESLGQFCSILIGRLLKSRPLRQDRSSLSFAVTPVILLDQAAAGAGVDQIESQLCTSFEAFDTFVDTLANPPIAPEAFAEIRSVIEGAKVLSRPQKRVIDNPAQQKMAVALSALEAEIANFDQKQRRAALSTIPGPHRIRGLAGSGKTVILAMKAATLHLNRPNDQILVTFYTRSLRSLIKSLITRFFRHYKDEDPDWEKVHIRHGWGGANATGVYADACRRHGTTPLALRSAQAGAAGRMEPFDFACRDLLSKVTIKEFYDHVLIDEGQDFPGGFYELCFGLAKGEADRKNIVWAYDELQNILDIKIRSPEELFGKAPDGSPRVSLERAARRLSPGTTNDTVLSKCYRNQRRVLVTAHALGFGVYGNIVQLLESKDHWEDVGYEVVSGDFAVGRPVRILRPEANSPIALEQAGGEIINWHVAATFTDELSWVAKEVQAFMQGGLQPEDIIIIALDDRNARNYCAHTSKLLVNLGISTNNIIADPYNEPPFSLPGKVTLSTVYRAKGNEAAVVFAVGIDAISRQSRSGRNKLFTAFTRTKAWLRLSGVGEQATIILREVKTAQDNFPYLNFTMPDLKQVEFIQRDLSERTIRAQKIRDEYVRKLRDEGFRDEEIVDILAVEVKNGKA